MVVHEALLLIGRDALPEHVLLPNKVVYFDVVLAEVEDVSMFDGVSLILKACGHQDGLLAKLNPFFQYAAMSFSAHRLHRPVFLLVFNVNADVFVVCFGWRVHIAGRAWV